MGPFYVKQNGIKVKVWILVITCMWSRGLNLKVCVDMSTKEFLRALQIHIFEFGLPQICITDLGSQIVSGATTLSTFLSDPDTQSYFQENNIKSLEFQHFYKGHSQLGSLVEICVKMTKRLIYKTIKNNVLDFRDFEFLIEQTRHIINRRPIAFKESLRSNDGEDVPEAITPEKIIKGFELNSINVIPDLQNDPTDDPAWLPSDPINGIIRQYDKLKRVRKNLKKIYESEFLQTLIKQATNEKKRYVPCSHKNLKIGDVVIIKEENTKIHHYPMGIVTDILVNHNGEVTGATILKGKTREVTKRHSSNIIPILSPSKETEKGNPKPETMPSSISIPKEDQNSLRPGRKKVNSIRKAAQRSRKATRELKEKDLI